MIASVFKKVFTKGRSWLTVGVTALVMLLIVSWVPNFKLVKLILSSSTISFGDKVNVLAKLIGSLGASTTSLLLISTLLIALFFGINVAFLVHFFREKRASDAGRGVGASLGGALSGLLGFGCAACGTVFLGTLFGGAGGFLAVLPLGGVELSFLGVILLALSTYFLARRIYRPAVCSVNE